MFFYVGAMFVIAAVILLFSILIYRGNTQLINGFQQTHVSTAFSQIAYTPHRQKQFYASLQNFAMHQAFLQFCALPKPVFARRLLCKTFVQML